MWNSLRREDFSLQLFHIAGDVRQAAEGVYGAQPLSMLKAWGSADNFTGLDIAVGAGLRGDDDAVADGAVSGDSHLPGEQNAFADVG